MAAANNTTVATAGTRQRLIDAAYELFSRHGFHGIGLDQILRDAGVSKQTFYNHFESKDGLVLAVLEKRSAVEIAAIREMLREFGGTTDGRRRLDALWDVLDAWFNSPEFRGCIFITAAAEFPNHHDPAHQAAAEHARKLHGELCELAASAGASDAGRLAELLLMLMDGALIAKHVSGNAHAAQTAREAARLLVARHLGGAAATAGVALATWLAGFPLVA